MAGAALAQPPAAAPQASSAPPCDSVVMVRCEPPAAAAASASPRRQGAQRVDERRRGFNEPLDLDRIIIEADPLRRSVEEAMSDALVSRPPGGTHTFATAEGSQCSCMNRCPPIPFPCCQCAPHTSRYTLSPGSTPLR